MAISFFEADIGFSNLSESSNPTERLDVMENYLFMLLEQLKYTLFNLGTDNFNQSELDSITSPIYKKLSDTEGNLTELSITASGLAANISDAENNITALSLTAAGLGLRMTDAEGSITSLAVTAEGLSARMTSTEGDITTLSATAEGLSARISTAEGNITTLSLTASGLSTRVSNAEGNISSLSLTASGLSTRISNAEGNISSLSLTASGLSTRISSAEGNISSLQMTSNSFSVLLTDGQGGVNAANIVAAINSSDSQVSISATKINLSGYVTVTNLQTPGATIINGANITTGTITGRTVTGGKVKGNSMWSVNGYEDGYNIYWYDPDLAVSHYSDRLTWYKVGGVTFDFDGMGTPSSATRRMIIYTTSMAYKTSDGTSSGYQIGNASNSWAMKIISGGNMSLESDTLIYISTATDYITISPKTDLNLYKAVLYAADNSSYSYSFKSDGLYRAYGGSVVNVLSVRLVHIGNALEIRSMSGSILGYVAYDY